MVEIGDLLLGQRGLRVEVAHVQRALDVVLDPRPGIGDDPHRAGNAARRGEPRPTPARPLTISSRLSASHQIVALQRVEFVAGQKFVGALPDQRRLGDMRVAVEGGEVLGHRRETLNRHGASSIDCWRRPQAGGSSSSQPGGSVTTSWRAKMASISAMSPAEIVTAERAEVFRHLGRAAEADQPGVRRQAG